MNYKLIKLTYRLLAAVALSFCGFIMLFPDFVTNRLPSNAVMVICTCLFLPFIVLKLIYDEKYPPSKTKEVIGYVIAFLGLILSFFIDKII